MKKQIFLRSSQGARLTVDKTCRITKDRCLSCGDSRVVILGSVESGDLFPGDQISITDNQHMELHDRIARIEINRESQKKVTAGDRVGILLTDIDTKEFERNFPQVPNSLP